MLPPGSPRTQNYGAVLARFVRQGLTADAAIRARLERLGKSARTWTVVSSDLEVQAAARQVRAHYLSAEAFASKLEIALAGQPPESDREAPQGLSEAELDEWLELFGEDGEGQSRPKKVT
jgi:predicted RNA-binding protein with PIN domain